MANTPTTMRLDPGLKDEALKILESLKSNITGAVTIFLKAVVRENGLPFDMNMNDGKRVNVEVQCKDAVLREKRLVLRGVS